MISCDRARSIKEPVETPRPNPGAFPHITQGSNFSDAERQELLFAYLYITLSGSKFLLTCKITWHLRQ